MKAAYPDKLLCMMWYSWQIRWRFPQIHSAVIFCFGASSSDTAKQRIWQIKADFGEVATY